MASLVLLDCKIVLDGYDLSGFHNQISLEYGAEMLDDTVFGTSGTRSNKPGLKTVTANGTVFWDSTQDEANFGRIGAARAVLSIAPEGNVEGDRIFFTRAVNAQYNPVAGEVGALMESEFDANAANTPLVRGVVLATGEKSASGTGVGVLISAIPTGWLAYSALHVTAIGSGSLVVTVESAADAGFSTPTVRLTHTTFLGSGEVGSDWQELPGPVVGDTYWRSSWTIVGGPFSFFHSFGIQQY